MNVATDWAGFQPLSRRALICASPVLFASPAMAAYGPPAPMALPDPLPALVDAYFAAQEAWEAGTDEPDSGNFDNETCRLAQAELDRLRPLIEGTTATTAEGIIAQFAYIEADFVGGRSERDGPTIADLPVSLLHRLAVAVERLP